VATSFAAEEFAERLKEFVGKAGGFLAEIL
jgi:hypothetical protein